MAINSRGFGGSGHGKRVGPGSCLVGRLVIMSFAWWIDGWTEDRLRGGCTVKEKETAFVFIDLFQSREAMRDIVLLGIQEGEYCHHVL